MSSSFAVRLRLAVASLTVLVVAGLALHLATPRTRGVQGDWSAQAVDGRVVADRAVVSGDNTALDLRTGKTVTLGSVSGAPDGPVVAELVQDGRCVVSAYATASAQWTRVLDVCPLTQPTIAAADGSVTLTWPTTAQRLDLATGRTLPATRDEDGATASGITLARTSETTAVESRERLHTNPFRWGHEVTIIQLRDGATDDVRAQVVSGQLLTLLRLENDAVVVRDGSRVVRYTLNRRD